jgi:hypothetical protein
MTSSPDAVRLPHPSEAAAPMCALGLYSESHFDMNALTHTPSDYAARRKAPGPQQRRFKLERLCDIEMPAGDE